MNAKKVVFDFVRTNFLTRWPCHVCGGCTEKVIILCEVARGKHEGLRICEQCLRAGKRKVDTRLRAHIARLEADANELRSLIGRLEAPTYRAWLKAEKQADGACAKSMKQAEKARIHAPSQNSNEVPF